jgi:hypothetical protein
MVPSSSTRVSVPLLAALALAHHAGPPAKRVDADPTGHWQGAWVVRDTEYPGSVQAWQVQGTSVLVYDPSTGRSESQQFRLESPCRVVRTRSSGDGGTVESRDNFAFASDGLHVGPPEAAGGVRQGPVLTACAGEQMYTLDLRTGTCHVQPADMSGSQQTADCTLSPTPPSLVLRRFGEGQDTRLDILGDGLLSMPLAASATEPQPSLERAIARANVLALRR